MIPADFHFLRPWWLLALVPLVFMTVRVLRRRLERSLWARCCDPALVPHVLVQGRTGRRLSDPALLGASVAALAILALAGPVWERLPTPVFKDRAALIIALDLSRSMDAADVSPSRLIRARFKIADVLERRRSGQAGLLVYAAAAFAVTPLTDDTRTLLAQLPALETGLMPAQGSRADLAVRKAIDLLRQGGARSGDILLVTDGVSAGDGAALRRLLADAPVRLFVLGVGTREGAPIPNGRAGFVQRPDGELVTSRLMSEPLATLARASGGQYLEIAADDRDVVALTDAIERGREHTAVAGDDGELLAPQWRERGPWLLLAALPLGAFLFRRGIVVVLLAGLLLPLPRQASAFGWADLWQRPDQRASRVLEAGEPARAAGLFEDPGWRGSAHYRAGEFEAAAQAFADRDGAADRYNRGNALARLGRYEEALQAYDEALARAPDDEDARYNRELVRQQLEQPPGQSGGAPDQQRPPDEQQAANESEDGKGDTSPAASPSAQSRGDGEQAGREPDRGGDQEATGDATAQAPQQRDPSAAGEPAPQPQTAQSAQDAPQPPGQGEDSRARIGAEGDQEAQDEEQQQANEQWLRRIPDDPGGLLRRKFLYQYKQMQPQAAQEQPW